MPYAYRLRVPASSQTLDIAISRSEIPKLTKIILDLKDFIRLKYSDLEWTHRKSEIKMIWDEIGFATAQLHEAENKLIKINVTLNN